MEEFEKGLPNYGVGVKYYNVGSLLHPYYRGYTLKNIANSEEGREAAVKELVDNHPTTIQFFESVVDDHTSLEISDLDETMDPVDLEFLKDRRQVSAQRPGTSQSSQSKLKPPLMLELEKYQTMALPEIDVDTLEWWKQNKNELPLLAGLARSYLAIPVTSASSERMFSVGGRTVTDFRHNVKPENTSMLVFVSQNYARVPSNLNNWEKICEEEPYELPHVTPPTKNTHQQGKSRSQTETKKRGAPEKASPTQSDTQIGPEHNEQQQLQLDTQESQRTLAQREGYEVTQGKDQTQSVPLFIPMTLQHKKIRIKKEKLSNIMKSNWKGNEKKSTEHLSLQIFY